MTDAPRAPCAVEGEFTIYRVAELRETLLAWLPPAAACGQVVLDLSAVTEIDGAGIQLLLSLQRSSQALGAALQLQAPSAPVRDMLSLLMLNDRLPCAADPA